MSRRSTATQNGIERELTIDEALELQTYQAALKGNRMAVRAVLKMIEKREVALRKAAPRHVAKPKPYTLEYDSNSADEAMKLLNIICRNPAYGNGGRTAETRRRNLGSASGHQSPG